MRKEHESWPADPLVNLNTGELIDTSQLYELELGERIFTNKQREFLRQKDARYQDPTPFVWLNFQYNTNLDFPVDKAVAVRYLYFGTACGADGVIQKSKLMRAKLNLDKNQQTSFIKQTLQSGLLYQRGSAFFVNQQILSWGERETASNHIRVYSHYYRRLCEGTNSQAELKRIYYFIQMIP